jgi:hypothetical protein
MILALGGTALAASKLTGPQKKEVEKIAKKYAGKDGAPGAAGTNGTNGQPGAKGDTGAPGSNGTNGTPGKDGTNGKDGTSVTNTAVPTSSTTCNRQGGAEFKVGAGTPTTACNGITGFTDTLPSGKTETGTWNISEHTTVEGNAFSVVSFPIPLSAPGDSSFFSLEQTEEEEFGSSGCSGDSPKPAAPLGTLCLYTTYEVAENAHRVGVAAAPTRPFEPEPAYGPTGALLFGYTLTPGPEGHPLTEPARVEAFGTWAVTAP